MSNIYDIAEQTGYSPSTVARALSGKGYVGKKTKDAIIKSADELGYKPNFTARSLRSKKTYKILMCIPDLYNEFYFGMIQGANSVLEKYGYYILLCHSKHSLQEELKIINMLNEGYGDGMIFISFDFNKQNVEALSASNMPVVATNRILCDDTIDYIYVDHTKATYIATSHLISCGHRNIGILIGNTKEQTSKERFDGYAQALNENNIPLQNGLKLISDYSRDYTHKTMTKFITSHPQLPMTAVVACNDLMGIGCMDICKKYNIRIPEDLSLVTLDNTDICTYTTPQLTTIDMMQEEIGKSAAILLLEQLEGRKGVKKTVTLEPKLITRNSIRYLV